MKIHIIKLLYCFCTFFHPVAAGNEAVLDLDRQRLQPLIAHFFPSKPLEEFQWRHLSGGYSDAYNYKIDCTSCAHPYVIRLHQESQSLKDVKREFWVFEQASKLGIAPHVYDMSLEDKALLTDYQEARTLTVEQAQESDTIKVIASTFIQVHKIPKNPFTNQPIAQKFRQRAQGVAACPFINEALEIINTSEKELLELPTIIVTLHGDPNPRNIFVKGTGVKFVDWADTTWDEAFYDLSYFALLANYNKQQQKAFLQSYLGHEPGCQDWKRYLLTEKINVAGFSIVLFTTALSLAERPLNENGPIYEWAHYAEKFASGYTLSVQDIFDWSKAGLRKAKTSRLDETDLFQ